jgi:HAD superfamily hydrolase (TIGR01509 family)
MRYELVIFDMDGTLTEDLLDFPRIRAEIGVVGSGGILEHISHLGKMEQEVAQGILDGHELAAARACVLKEGAAEVLGVLRKGGVKMALLTRNSPVCMRTVMGRHGLMEMWDHISTREDQPHKPHGESILRITKKLGASVRKTLMVGDYLYDVEAARNAGCDCALLLDEEEWGERPAYAALATYCIGALKELLAILEMAEQK